MVLNFEMDKLVNELKERKPLSVLVQLPEGVKQNAYEIKKEIEELGIKVFFSGESCWGGCAVATYEAKTLGVDLIVHFGHAKFVETDFPILYMIVRDELDLSFILERSLSKLNDYKKIGLSYAIQHMHEIPMVVKFFEEHGKEVVMSKKMGHAAYEGHVIGCEFAGLKEIAGQVEAFVILGNNFHSMGAALAVEKPVVLLDVYNDAVTDMEGVRDKIMRQRIMSIEKFKEAKKVGIVVEVKAGQRFGAVDFIREKLEKAGKEVIVIAMDEMSPDKLMNFYDVDAFVELACPRIAIDDFAKYPKTVITFKEALVAVGDKSVDEMISLGFI